jgi:hypothetical protein
MAVTLTSTGIQYSDSTTQTTLGTTPYRNKLINSQFYWPVRLATPSVSTSASAAHYVFTRGFDPWGIGAHSGSSTLFSATMQRAGGYLGSAPNPVLGYLSITTGTVSGSSGRIDLRQCIESMYAQSLRNKDVTISWYGNAYPAATINWALYYANTADTWTITTGTGGSLTSGATLIGSGTWSVGNSPSIYQATVNAGANAGNGLMLVFSSVGPVSNQSWALAYVQLEAASTATPYEIRPPEEERILIGRYTPFLPPSSVATSTAGNRILGYGWWNSSSFSGSGSFVIPFNGQIARKHVTGIYASGSYYGGYFGPNWSGGGAGLPAVDTNYHILDSVRFSPTGVGGLSTSGTPVPGPLYYAHSYSSYLAFTGAEL